MELAVTLAIVGLLLGGLMYTLSSQFEQRNLSDTQRRLEDARELLIGFAIQNGRLPCPATAASLGDESPSGGGSCTTYLSGFLPAKAIGFLPVDSAGFAVDAWGNRIRYAVAENAVDPSGSGSTCTAPVAPAFTNATNLKSSTNGISCGPRDIVICDSAQNTNSASAPPSCGTYANACDARSVTNQRTVTMVVFSTGKNGATGSGGADDAENIDGDGVFVFHEPRPTGASCGGEYDDQVIWIPAGLLYGRLVSAGVLP